ncbi:hypothetical protein, partial [Mediterraneibacter gnavus]|uniref:hypothetical protein n=1 Tax=Mediterraneibacter gnavus TaxID=33038 RepID=UPI001FA85DE3
GTLQAEYVDWPTLQSKSQTVHLICCSWAWGLTADQIQERVQARRCSEPQDANLKAAEKNYKKFTN